MIYVNVTIWLNSITDRNFNCNFFVAYNTIIVYGIYIILCNELNLCILSIKIVLTMIGHDVVIFFVGHHVLRIRFSMVVSLSYPESLI